MTNQPDDNDSLPAPSRNGPRPSATTKPSSTRERSTDGLPGSATPVLRLIANSPSSAGGRPTTSLTTDRLPSGVQPGAAGLRELRGMMNAAADAADVDRCLTSLVGQLLGPALAARREMADDPYADLPVIAYDISDDAPRDVLDQVITIAGLAMVPAPNEFIIGELYRLRMLTAGQNKTDFDLQATFRFYAEDLEEQRYPADVVRSACRRWARRGTFWPALGELIAECDALVRERRILLRDLERGPNVHKPTAEEIAERQRYVEDRDRRYAEAREWQQANPPKPWRKPTAEEIAAEESPECRAHQTRAGGPQDREPIPLPTPFVPSESFARAQRALHRRDPKIEPPDPVLREQEQ
jgi:hypothetical protein